MRRRQRKDPTRTERLTRLIAALALVSAPSMASAAAAIGEDPDAANPATRVEVIDVRAPEEIVDSLYDLVKDVPGIAELLEGPIGYILGVVENGDVPNPLSGGATEGENTSCSDSRRGWASCHYSCATGATISLDVEGGDTGDTQCGGVALSCHTGKTDRCHEEDGPTDHAEDSAKCHGEAPPWEYMSVTCKSKGPDDDTIPATTSSSVAHLYMGPDVVVGAVCQGDDCHLVRPRCELTGTLRRCGI